MRYYLTTLAFGPFLLAQGLYVRRNTPLLPEPPGARSGCSGTGRRLRVLILGDSAAAGVGAASQLSALSGQLVAALSTDFQLDWKLLAQTGHKAREVLARLEQAEPEVFDVVLTSIGVNDVTGGSGLRRWQREQRLLIELLKVKFQARHIFLSSLPPMEHFTALPFPLRGYLGMRAGRFSRALANIAAADERCSMIDVNFPFDPSYLAADGFHPGEPAYTLWAQRSAMAIKAHLSPSVATTES